MKRLLFLLMVSFFLLSGFEHQDDLEIVNIETTVIESQKTLRYDFEIKNTSSERVGGEFDYPGHNIYGMELVVIPGKKLEPLMEMETGTKYKKMKPSGFGGSGFIRPNGVGKFHAEYHFKEEKDLEKVREFALNATLRILHGTNIIAELPLK
ncbi:hypothetical protein KO561_00860 [Radiobacillus kanasensis]|uniref:hypothetical protein n=1 Tax=Radiobacillus kanasensis TaxID=2844358 RepID=UPI001E325334|nr:hypothetical protein [Radiobacillus kanasensis]UFT99562.1 hypothetical protein KO561_00860 [Radiobacillus kanasensis]